MQDFFLEKIVLRYIGPDVYKNAESFSNSPDVRKYPFVLGFRTKDMARQQELLMLKFTALSLQKNHKICVVSLTRP